MTAAQWRCAAKWELCLGDIFSCYYRDSDGVKAIMQITLPLWFVKGFASFYFVSEHCKPEKCFWQWMAHGLGGLVWCLKHPCVIPCLSQGHSLKSTLPEKTDRFNLPAQVSSLIPKGSSVVCGEGEVSQERCSILCVRLYLHCPQEELFFPENLWCEKNWLCTT